MWVMRAEPKNESKRMFSPYEGALKAGLRRAKIGSGLAGVQFCICKNKSQHRPNPGLVPVFSLQHRPNPGLVPIFSLQHRPNPGLVPIFSLQHRPNPGLVPIFSLQHRPNLGLVPIFAIKRGQTARARGDLRG
jgi:hypothetical protein